METNKIPIKIYIDNDISVNMEIQREMTAIEFQGLMLKAKKLFNISNTTDEMPIHYKLKNHRRKGIKWTDESIQILKDNYSKTPASELVRMINIPEITNDLICKKAYQFGLKKDKTVFNMGSSRSIFTDEEIDIISKMYKNRASYKMIAKKVNKTIEQVKNKIKLLRNKGVINDRK